MKRLVAGFILILVSAGAHAQQSGSQASNAALGGFTGAQIATAAVVVAVAIAAVAGGDGGSATPGTALGAPTGTQ
jgi:hypothetical protein